MSNKKELEEIWAKMTDKEIAEVRNEYIQSRSRRVATIHAEDIVKKSYNSKETVNLPQRDKK